MLEEKPHYHGHRARLRERFLKSAREGNTSSLPDYEILEMILFSCFPRKDVKPIAKGLLKEFGSLSNLFSCDIEKLEKSNIINESTLTMIKVIYETSSRILQTEIREKPILQSWKAVLDHCQLSMGNIDKEQFRILFLNQKHYLIADEVQQRGTVDQTPVYPREVVKRALDLGSSSLILVHNHPSGDPKPSKADIEITEQIEIALNAINIKLHDHLIIAGNKHFSFAGNGLI